MNARKSLAVMAIAGSLLGMTACSSDKPADEPYHLTVNGEDKGMVTGDGDPVSENPGTETPTVPTDFTDDAAKSALAEVCSKLPLTDMATLLGVPTVEMRDGVAEAQDSLDKGNVYCTFMEPSADEYGVDGWGESQTFASVSVAGAAVRACEGCSGGTVDFPDGSTGYYAGTDDTALRVTPEGSPYEFSFSVVLPHEATSPSSLDQETTNLFRSKAADLAHMTLG